ncbi:MAG: hypothetical protein ABR508_10985 [Candidatus Baltobacteraceae bacterium]
MMHGWAAVCASLAAAGIILALFSLLALVTPALRLRRRVDALSNSRLARSLEGLQRESQRMRLFGARVAPLRERAGAAAASIAQSRRELELPHARRALDQAGRDIAALVDELR